MTSTHKVTVMVEAATGIGADGKVSEAGVVETLLYAALLEAAEVVATTADVVVRARLSENESRDQGGKKECGTERRVKGEHGVKTDGRGRCPETAEGDSRERTRRKRGKRKRLPLSRLHSNNMGCPPPGAPPRRDTAVDRDSFLPGAWAT